MDSDLENRVLEHLRDPKYRPQNKSEMARALDLPPKDRSDLRAILGKLEGDGTILKLKRGRFSLRSSGGKGNVLVGTLRFRPSGDAFLLPDLSDPQNRAATQEVTEHTRIRVGSRFTGTALPGDRVAVAVEQSGVPKWWKHVARKRDLMRQMEEAGEMRWQGRVVKILERARNRFVGTYRVDGIFHYVSPDEPGLPSIEISRTHSLDEPGPAEIELPEPGQKVLVNVVDWASRHSHPRGEIVEVLGDPDAPGVDVMSIIHRYNLPVDFPDRVLKEADQQAARGVPEEEAKEREDWRKRFVITIDPEDAKDFDDAISVEELPDGGWELAVHIADVSFYVRPGTALDQEALERGNSTYLVDRVIPMLPEALSNGICSLRPDEDRLTRAVVMRFDKDGNRVGARFIKSVIRSRKRLAYEEAYALMISTRPDPSDEVAAMLKRSWDLASLIRKRRFENGSLDLDFPEVKVILNDQGKPVDLRLVQYDESHQLIEEFMLSANEAVAQHLKKRSSPSIYRVHDDPDEAKLFEFRNLAQLYGHHVGDLTNRSELQALLKMIKGRPEEQALKLGLLKSMKRAAYHADPLGHYGLAKSDYTHFTSPIRRYADLIVHRVLYKERDDVATPRYARMGEIAEHISETERTSASAEMDSVQLKKLEFMNILVRNDPNRTFEALIHDIRRMGVFVEIGEMQVKGLVKAEDLPGGDDYDYEPALQRFVGHYHGRKFELGQTIEVRLKQVDPVRNMIDFRAV